MPLCLVCLICYSFTLSRSLCHCNKHGDAALNMVAQNGQFEVVEMLLNKGVLLDAVDGVSRSVGWLWYTVGMESGRQAACYDVCSASMLCAECLLWRWIFSAYLTLRLCVLFCSVLFCS
jgi:uncharacterized membrane protein